MSDFIDQITDTVSDGIQNTVNAWLDGPTTSSVGNKAAHWAAITAGATAGTGNALCSWRAWASLPQGQLVWNNSMSPKIFDMINKTAQILSQPNIEGIPIWAESQSGTRDVTVTEQMIISQAVATDNGKSWITDNAAPKPTVWQLEGYLQTIATAIDAYLLVKPSIVAQVELLDAYAKSRRPVWFKPYYYMFKQVLIESFTHTHVPNAQNAVKVSLTLREFSTYEATHISADSILGVEV